MTTFSRISFPNTSFPCISPSQHTLLTSVQEPSPFLQCIALYNLFVQEREEKVAPWSSIRPRDMGAVSLSSVTSINEHQSQQPSENATFWWVWEGSIGVWWGTSAQGSRNTCPNTWHSPSMPSSSSSPSSYSSHSYSHTSYLSLFYTTTIWGLRILHLEVRKCSTKVVSRQNSVN